MSQRDAADYFQELVIQALDSLPDDIAAAMTNVEVVIEDEPPVAWRGGGTLLGLYHGIPLTERRHYTNAMPDKITIFRGPITRLARTPERIRDQVRKTVVHEIAHHFGIDDDRLRELGW
jgi:predicted Zn-dependent protease with MMP-like domain